MKCIANLLAIIHESGFKGRLVGRAALWRLSVLTLSASWWRPRRSSGLHGTTMTTTWPRSGDGGDARHVVRRVTMTTATTTLTRTICTMSIMRGAAIRESPRPAPVQVRALEGRDRVLIGARVSSAACHPSSDRAGRLHVRSAGAVTWEGTCAACMA